MGATETFLETSPLDMTDSPTDWEMAVRIGRAADQVICGLRELAPKRATWRLSLVQMWDLEGRVDELPDLGIVCTTAYGFPGSDILRFVGFNVIGGGVGKLEENGRTRTVIVFPNMLHVAANRREIEAHGLLHHELAHLLYGHDPDEVYAGVANARRGGKAYFNHPMEVDAYLHQALSMLVRANGGKSWANCDLRSVLGSRDTFFDQLAAQLPRPFLEFVTPETMGMLRDRSERFWEAGYEAVLAHELGCGATPSSGR